MDKSRSKMVGGPRSLRGKPGTVAFYKENIPERFNNTMITVRNTGGFDVHDAEIIAARVLRWNEGVGPERNAMMIDRDRAQTASWLAKSDY
jgi:hypothetical protein